MVVCCDVCLIVPVLDRLLYVEILHLQGKEEKISSQSILVLSYFMADNQLNVSSQYNGVSKTPCMIFGCII